MAKEKRPYEPPAFRKVRLEVKSSVLAVCSLSTSVSPIFGTCKTVAPCLNP